ncbi:hypothetical protein TRICI_003222 [Trichomonascus ciferrii]|uniref:Major facilitator superfamily (MFS) profile domain-containing protein n=1 Tax=Trichomonascus ciferrii TaxID=44093 RepID=A0A642V3R1_9ASCO|nr:hypothetical protein TRICI_003222 [Trichomonascus ciferrii]
MKEQPVNEVPVEEKESTDIALRGLDDFDTTYTPKESKKTIMTQSIDTKQDQLVSDKPSKPHLDAKLREEEQGGPGGSPPENGHDDLLDQKSSTARLIRATIALIVFAGAQILDVLNLTGLMFSEQPISQQYNISLDEASWVVSAYSLTLGSMIILGGRLGDFLGYRLIFMVGMSIMGLCSLVLAIVQNAYVLFVFRAIQGVGAAFTIPTSFALTAHTFEGKARELALALIGTAAAMGGIVGILVGGAFTETSIGYRGLMYLSFGLACFFTIAVYFVTKETQTDPVKAKQLDYPGAVILVCGTLLVIFGFTSAPGRWRSARVIAPIVIGGLLLLFFIYYEYRISYQKLKIQPLIPGYVWKFPNLTIVFFLGPLNFANLYVTLFALSNQLIVLRGETPLSTAVKFIPYGVGFAVACVIGGALFSVIPPKILLTVGPLLDIAGSAINAQVDQEIYWQYIFVSNILLSFGTGLFMSTFINTVVSSAPLDHQGIVSGVCMTGGQLGTAITLAISTSEIGDGFTRSNYQNAYYTLCAYAGLAVILTLIFIKPSAKKSPPSETADHTSIDLETKTPTTEASV